MRLRWPWRKTGPAGKREKWEEWEACFKKEADRLGFPWGVALQQSAEKRQLILLVWQARRDIDQRKLLWIAMISAIASVISAAAAWVGALHHAH